MRSVSLSQAKQIVESRWKPKAKVSEKIANAKNSTAARYLQLKSGHAVTGAHLLRIGKVKDAQCWWCGKSSQTAAHLLLRCRKWRRQRDSMMRGLRAERVFISASRDGADLDSLCRAEATTKVLQFIADTEVGRPLVNGENRDDYWDMEKLDQRLDEEQVRLEDGGE
jgi:hypothetical protein